MTDDSNVTLWNLGSETTVQLEAHPRTHQSVQLRHNVEFCKLVPNERETKTFLLLVRLKNNRAKA